MCVCVCVRERDRDRDRGGEKEYNYHDINFPQQIVDFKISVRQSATF